MTLATLGGLIKDYRLKKRLSQMEVSLRIGWSDTTRLSKIEQGRVGKPTRETVDKIIKALGLTNQEQGEFLLAGGYLPTDKETEKAIKLVRKRIDAWTYPSYLIDFSWRVLWANDQTLKVFQIPLPMKNKKNLDSRSARNKLIKNKLNLWDYFFSPLGNLSQVKKVDDQGKVLSFREAEMAIFKMEQHGRENEKWYQQLIKRLMSNEDFRRVWQETNVPQFSRELINYEHIIVNDYGKNPQPLHFHVFTVKVIQDQRFEIVFYLPVSV